jgi:hypothetical protein
MDVLSLASASFFSNETNIFAKASEDKGLKCYRNI